MLRHRFLPQGQIILGIDGLKPDVGHEVLWVLRDCLSSEVLLARSLLSEAEEELVTLSQEAQAMVPVPITGVISDGQTGLRPADAKALPTIPHQLCQYHYLREAAKPIYEADRHAKKDLKALVRDIRPVERLMERVIAHQPEITPAYIRGLSEEEAHIVQDYCLAVRSALTDDGQTPLCAAGLRLQGRLTKIAASLQQAMLKGAAIGGWSTRWSASSVLVPRGLTHTAARWPPIQTAYALVFRAVHILNNDEQVSAEAVQRRYAQVLNEIRMASADPGTDAIVKGWYTTFLKVTASYGDALFWCYDHPDLPRTNNDLEHLFGSLRYHERWASGRKQVAPMLLLRGQARVPASVSTRLRTYQAIDLPPSDLARWRVLRKALDARQETRRQQ